MSSWPTLLTLDPEKPTTGGTAGDRVRTMAHLEPAPRQAEAV